LPKAPVTRSPQLAAALKGSFIRPFDLSRAPLLRVGLMRSGKDKHILMLDMHHIIADGRSTEIITKDLMGFFAGKKLPAFRLQYKDYCRWQDNQVETGVIKQQESYWLNRFAGEVPVLGLPIDYTRPRMQSFAGHSLTFAPGTESIQRLKKLALEEGGSFFMVLLAVFNILLARVSGQEDIVVGTGVEGRRHHDLRQIVGMFVGTLALRNFPRADKSFRDFLWQLKQDVSTKHYRNPGDGNTGIGVKIPCD
jgi:hypothetical protein